MVNFEVAVDLLGLGFYSSFFLLCFVLSFVSSMQLLATQCIGITKSSAVVFFRDCYNVVSH